MDTPRPRVYVETTIPSAYYTDRDDPVMRRRRDATRRWLAIAAATCELVASLAVMRELAKGTSSHVPARLALVDTCVPLEITPSAIATAETYVRRRIMPAHPFEDALHLALASHHRCAVLATWDFRHLANPTKFDFIRRINTQLRLPVPLITTPEDLLGENDGRDLAP